MAQWLEYPATHNNQEKVVGGGAGGVKTFGNNKLDILENNNIILQGLGPIWTKGNNTVSRPSGARGLRVGARSPGPGLVWGRGQAPSSRRVAPRPSRTSGRGPLYPKFMIFSRIGASISQIYDFLEVLYGFHAFVLKISRKS